MARDRRPQLRDLDVEIPMEHLRVALRILRFLPLAAVLLLAIPSSYAQTVDLSGRYQCAQAKMHGKVIPCNAAPLILKNDGRFELRATRSCCVITGSTAWWK
jgi:hypothetical protein